MYDKKTSSLWNTLQGKPVVGPLVGRDIKLRRRSVVTTTWGEWKARHPRTTVLSLETGHRRDYGEGVAYKDYFGTDQLMFEVPGRDKRLPNKREVLALRAQDGSSAVALDTEFLKKTPLYTVKVGDDDVVIVTTKTGETRAYNSQGMTFTKWDGHSYLTDKDGIQWWMTEGFFKKQGAHEKLLRYPSHQSFWFGWHAQFPETRLIH